MEQKSVNNKIKKGKKFYFEDFQEDKKEFFIEIKKGEIVSVSMLKEAPFSKKICFHNLKNPDWKAVETVLECCYRNDKETFYEIYKGLYINSYAFSVAKKLLTTIYNQLKEEIKKMTLLIS